MQLRLGKKLPFLYKKYSFCDDDNSNYIIHMDDLSGTIL